MRVRTGLAILAVMGALASSAGAQAPFTPARSDPTDPDAVIVEELVVTARLPGPAWWTVTNGQSTVYVLGAPSLAPRRMAWDRSVLDRRLRGANQVILPLHDVRVSLIGAPGAALNYLRLKAFSPFEVGLDPDLRARFVAAREKLGQPAAHYKTRNALAAALQLIDDYRANTGLTVSDPGKLIKLLAAQAKVPVRQRSYELGPLMGAMIRTSPEVGRACLGEVMTQVQAGPGVTLAAARAWSEGDVRGALANERTFERCIAQVPGAQAFDARMKTDQVADIEAALKRPGHSIAVVWLRPLLAQGGVLDQLKAKGFEVKTPGDE